MDNIGQTANTCPTMADTTFGTKVSYGILIVVHLVAVYFFFKKLLFKKKTEESPLVFVHNQLYTSFESRLQSFENCKAVLPHYTCTFCEAGFYYAGDGENDGVACFSCNIHLKEWENHDNPWVQHARWSRDCTYLLLCKGKDFIDRIHCLLEVENIINDQLYVNNYYELEERNIARDSPSLMDFDDDLDADFHPLLNYID